MSNGIETSRTIADTAKVPTVKRPSCFESPPRTWHHDDGVELSVGATMQSVKHAMGTLVIAAFWNGFTSFFVLAQIASSFHHAGMSIPRWLPSLVTNASGVTGGGSIVPLGVGIFLWIALIPLVFVGLGMVGIFFVYLAGRVVVTVREGHGVIFLGIGPIGYRRRFNASQVTSVSLRVRNWTDEYGKAGVYNNVDIWIDGAKPVRFGTLIPPERRRFVAAALQSALGRGDEGC